MARWGLTVPLSERPLHEQLDRFREAEELGYTDLWSLEVDGSDAFTPLAAAATVTSHVRLGTAIAGAYTRGPMALAMHAASLAELAPERFVLGVGSASTPIVEWWNGIPFDRPRSRVRDSIEVVRRLLDGERVTAELETMKVRGARLSRPPATRVPIFLAALRPRMLRLAAQVADGVLLNFVAPEDVPRIVAIVREAAVEAGRDPAAIEIACRVFVLPTEDRAAGLAVAKRFLAGYLTVPTYVEFEQWLGRGEALQAMNNAWAEGDRRGALEALPESIVDELMPVGSPEHCKEQVQRYVEQGVDVPIMWIFRTEHEPEDNSYGLRGLAP